MSDRPDVIGLACDAGGYDRSAFEAGYALHVQAELLGSIASAKAAAQVVTRPEFVASLDALAASVGGSVMRTDPDGDTDDAVLVLIDCTEAGTP